MIVVTTPTGNIGSLVVKDLLSAGEAVRVIVRDQAKLSTEIRGRVEVVEGSRIGRVQTSRESVPATKGTSGHSTETGVVPTVKRSTWLVSVLPRTIAGSAVIAPNTIPSRRRMLRRCCRRNE